ncbi:hypothetical protein Taro_027247 [Colocasia esculenta]|uniref:Uncharacterized protein n=1 Tax=Colocasia esculenta TaxID=4460 RepID=A0A843VJL2_COLES|nr:hypothetical protein [Colocasia esculenta]
MMRNEILGSRLLAEEFECLNARCLHYNKFSLYPQILPTGTIEATESHLEGIRFEATESLLVPRRKWRTERRSGSQVDEGDAASGSAHGIREGSEEGVKAGNGQGAMMLLRETLSIIGFPPLSAHRHRHHSWTMMPQEHLHCQPLVGLPHEAPPQEVPTLLRQLLRDLRKLIVGADVEEKRPACHHHRHHPLPRLAYPRPARQRPLPPLACPRLTSTWQSPRPHSALPLPRPVPHGVNLPPSLPPFPESGKVPEEDAPTLNPTSPSPQPPATLSQSMEGISLLQLLHCSEMVSTAAFRIEMGMSSSCPFCNLHVPLADLEWYFFSLLCFPKFDPIFGWCSDKMDAMIKKKVEDAMPIATGLEREELKVKLENVMDCSEWIVPFHVFKSLAEEGLESQHRCGLGGTP